jgi:hypothetical protein
MILGRWLHLLTFHQNLDRPHFNASVPGWDFNGRKEGLLMSRGVFWLGVGIFVVAGAFLLTDWMLWKPGVTEANVKCIRPGMTVQQVECLLGGPRFLLGRIDRSDSSSAGLWFGPQGEAVVLFDQYGRAEGGEFRWTQPRPLGPLDRLWAWLGL